MNKKRVSDFMISFALMIIAIVVTLLPVFKIENVRLALIFIFSFYTVLKLTQFVLVWKYKDYQSLFTSIISLGVLIAVLKVSLTAQNIALILLIWIGFMCLVKLKKADFYHDRENKMWILRVFILFIFLTCGLITSINLYYEAGVQELMLGFFFLINSSLEAIDPIACYIAGEENETN